jgi:hypothetical protein
MLNKILTLLQGLCNALAWWRKRSHKKERDAISQAVHTGDEKTVNDLNARILKDSLRVLLGLLCLPLFGCSQRTIYVPENAKAVPMVHEGVQGWWEPNGLYEAKLLILHEHLERCHKE